jgi:CHAT domain-containing protein
MQLFKQAIACYDIALELSPRDLLPQRHRRLANASARAHLELALMQPDHASTLAQAWKVASSGVEAARLLERLAPSLELRQDEWSENAELYAIAGTIRALQGEVGEAVTLLEAGRARGLSEALGRKFADLSVLTATERREYDAAVSHVLELEAEGRQGGDFHRTLSLAAQAATANAALASVVERLQKAHSTFLPERRTDGEILAAGLHNQEALFYLVPQFSGTLMVTVSQSKKPQAEWLTTLTNGQLTQLDYFPAIMDSDSIPLEEALDTLLPFLGERLMRRVVQRARELEAQRLVLVPGGLLAVLPLHAAVYTPLASGDVPTTANGQRYACDDLVITYAPSGASYLAARTAAERIPTLQQGFIVGNPKLSPGYEPRWEPDMEGYLPYASEEAEAVKHLMEEAGLRVTCKTGAEATWRAVVDGLRNADVAHLAMHAFFDLDDPQASALQVAPQAKLFLRDLLDPLQVSPTRLRLAVLSACQSGLGDFQRLSEEAMGLFGAMLAGGAAGVVGSLWLVYDYSTKLLMEAFTQRYLRDSQEPSVALRNAIRSLRGLPDEVPAGYNESMLKSKQKAEDTEEVTSQYPSAQQQWKNGRLRESDPVQPVSYQLARGKERGVTTARYAPQDHPVHWAAFIYYGY